MSQTDDLAELMRKKLAATLAKKTEEKRQPAELPAKTSKPKREKEVKANVVKPPKEPSNATLSSPDQLTDLISKIVTQKIAEFKQTMVVPTPSQAASPPLSLPQAIISKKAVIQYIKANATKGLKTWLVKQNRVNDLNFLALMVNELAFGVVEDMLPVPQKEADADDGWDPTAEEGWVESKPKKKERG